MTSKHRLASRQVIAVACIAGALGFAACGSDDDKQSSSGSGGAAGTGGAAGSAGSAGADAGTPPPPFNPAAAARGFSLFYKERVHRAVLVYNRFGMFGDSGFATTIGSAAIAKTGADYEVVAGPKDNNLIGTSLFSVYQAYRIFRTRELGLTLIRMFNGLEFFEEVTGHSGLTSREVLPGWTRVMDGIGSTVTRTRGGSSVTHPAPPSPELETEILATFYDGVRITYRENPEEYYFSYLPAADVVDYSITHAHTELPQYLRVSDCCSSFMRTPDNQKWAGAFWGNHNSRDNFPDLALGFIAALEASQDDDADADVRDAAARALEAGRRVGDLIQDNGGNIMTVDEHNPYNTLVVSGDVRPHGLPENENLGALAACPDVFLAKAVATGGLSLPAPALPMPGTVEQALSDALGAAAPCPIPDPRLCMGLDDAYCGFGWSNFEEIQILGTPLFEFVEGLEQTNPGTAEALLGSFQNDYDDIVEAMVSLVHYARAADDDALRAEAQTTLGAMSRVMRRFADVIYSQTKPDRQASQRYEAAVFDALGGLEIDESDLQDFAPEEERIAKIEALLEMVDTQPAPLLTDQEIFDRVEQGLVDLGDHPSGRSDVIRQRYRDAFGMEPPVRRAGMGYEARQVGGPWVPVERPRHTRIGSLELLQALPICNVSPTVLDCSWAALGCARPDLDASGAVDSADQTAFDASFEDGKACDDANGWCDGTDLDRSGTLDGNDQAFMAAAQGCWYDP